MYVANMFPKEWPRRADDVTYRRYAKLPSWHVEEAASLVTGYEPRDSFLLQFFPMEGKPGTADLPETPPPYDGAKTWNTLIRRSGSIGAVLALYARFKRVPDMCFEADKLYVEPGEFLQFCNEFNVAVPPVLSDLLQPKGVPLAERSPKSAPKREQHYAECARRVASELRDCRACVTVSQLQTLVESEFPPNKRTVTLRCFQGYLEKWRRESRTAHADDWLAEVVRTDSGRPSEDDESELRRRLPPKFAAVLFPAMRPRAQETTKIVRSPRSS